MIALFFIAIIFISIFVCINLSNKNVDEFENILPKERYKDVINEFGNPDILINQPGGMAIWKKKDFFEEIILKDESIPHQKPKPHCDFLYAKINVYIPSKYILKILSLSESITYDKLKKELTARCHFMGANIATLYLALAIAKDPNNFEFYKSQYGSIINKTTNKKLYRNIYDELRKLIKLNKKNYK